VPSAGQLAKSSLRTICSPMLDSYTRKEPILFNSRLRK
jgi:hypothetical protein